jgi:hypothetical protein
VQALGHIAIAAIIQQFVDDNGRAITLGNVVFIPDDQSGGDATLAHEFTHTEQLRELAVEFGKVLGYGIFYGVETYDEFKDLMQQHDSDNPDNPYYTGDVAWNPRNWESYTFEQQAQIVSFAEFPNSNVSAFTFLSAQTIVPYTIKWAMLP